MREGRGNCLRYLKMGGTEKRRRDTKLLRRGGGGGKRGQGTGAGCLKRGGVEPPYELWVVTGDFFCDYSETSL